jgi:hypothetical protein
MIRVDGWGVEGEGIMRARVGSQDAVYRICDINQIFIVKMMP